MRKDVPLKDLHFGHEAKPPINARKVGRDTEIEQLAASIDAHGLGQALNVREIDGKIYVADGNRRLAALRLLQKKGNITADALVKADFDSRDGVGADELSLALNFERAPMHEADQYEKFWQLHQGGKTDEQIASRFGLEVKRVRKFLALGKLSPVLLEAWRNNEFQRPVEILQAFTLAPNAKEQEAVYKRLKKSGNLWSDRIRAAFGAGDRQALANLQFVGKAAYEAAGGKVIEDLFQEKHLVTNTALLQQLADKKFDTKVDELKADGWSWAEDIEALPYHWQHSWSKVKGGKKASAGDKAKSGCVIDVKDDGTLEIAYGVIKPAAAKPAKTTANKPGEKSHEKAPEPMTLSGALQQSLNIMVAKATAEALKAEPAVSPLAGLLAGIVGKQIDVNTGNHTPSTVRDQMKAIRDLISAPIMDAAARKAFDADRYFKGAPKGFVLKAIKEAVSPEQAKKLENGTKSAAWKFALENVPKTGWLPPELRAATYSGPGAKGEKKPAKAPPLKKAA